MSIHISTATAVEYLNMAVDVVGEDYTYKHNEGDFGPSCLYARRDENGTLRGSCIVGRVLELLNLPMDQFEYIESTERYNEDGTTHVVNENSVGTVLNLFPRLERQGQITYDDKALDVLYDAQHRQDNGETWGRAVRKAIAGIV